MRRASLLLAVLPASLWGQANTINCDQPADVQLSGASARANLTFTGQQGEAVYFRIIGVNADQGFGIVLPLVADQYGNRFQPRTQVSTNPGATPMDLAATSKFGQGFEFDLPSDSLYTLQIQANTSGGSGTVHVVMVRLNRPCSNTVALSCGRSAGGAISQGTADAPPALLGQMDTYTFNVQTGDTISFRLLRVPNSRSVDTTTYFGLAIYGPDGHVINVDPKNLRLTLATVYNHVELPMTVTGTLTLVVWEPTGVRGGNYYVSATRLNGGCGGPALTCSSFQDSQVTTPLSLASYTVQAAAGDVYQFRVARSDTSGTFAPRAEVYDSQGTLVGAAIQGSPSAHAAAAGNIAFRSAGTYSVLIGNTPQDAGTGAFTLAATLLNRPCTGQQALTCSSIVDGSIAGLLRNQVYTLTASAGDTYLIRLLQSNPSILFRPRVDVYDAAGTQLQFVNTANLARQNFTVPADGIYKLVVTDSYDNSQSGNYSFSLLRLNRPCDAGTLSCASPAAGNLARALASGVYTYTAAAAESFSVRMLPTGGVQPAIEVYDSQGNLTGQTLSGTFTGVDVVKPPAGTYTIVALDNSKTPGTGSFTLDLLRTRNACGQPLVPGQPVNGVVSAQAPFLSYTLPASTGDVLSLRSASSTPGFSAQMEIYDPDGNRLDAGVFGLTRTAAASGAYTIILGASAPRTAGGYAFAPQLLNNPAGAVPLACGSTAGGSLAGSGQFRYYTVSANAGDIMRMIFTKTSDNFAPQIELFDPTGARLAGNSDVTQKASAGGSYLVVVSPSTTAFESGSYTVAYQRPNNPCQPAALTCGQTTLRQVNLPGQLDTFTFNGTGGDLTTIRLASRSGNYSPFVEMYNAAGAKTTSSNGLLRSVLTASGPYTLLVRDSRATNLGSYRVSLQDDTNNCPVTDTDAPVITLLSPTGGEVLAGGTGFRIQWLSDDNVGVASHTIALSTDGGQTYPTQIVAGLNGNQQVYQWILPPDISPSRTAVIRVTATDAAGNAQSAASDLLTLIGSGFTPNATAAYTYDSLNRLTGATLGDGRTIQYTWDAAGNLIQITVTGQ